jgi:polyadenylation factor subunit 2
MVALLSGGTARSSPHAPARCCPVLPLQAEVRGAHEASIWAAAWHPAGHLLATGSADYAIKFWCR